MELGCENVSVVCHFYLDFLVMKLAIQRIVGERKEPSVLVTGNVFTAPFLGSLIPPPKFRIWLNVNFIFYVDSMSEDLFTVILHRESVGSKLERLLSYYKRTNQMS